MRRRLNSAHNFFESRSLPSWPILLSLDVSRTELVLVLSLLYEVILIVSVNHVVERSEIDGSRQFDLLCS